MTGRAAECYLEKYIGSDLTPYIATHGGLTPSEYVLKGAMEKGSPVRREFTDGILELYRAECNRRGRKCYMFDTTACRAVMTAAIATEMVKAGWVDKDEPFGTDGVDFDPKKIIWYDGRVDHSGYVYYLAEAELTEGIGSDMAQTLWDGKVGFLEEVASGRVKESPKRTMDILDEYMYRTLRNTVMDRLVAGEMEKAGLSRARGTVRLDLGEIRTISVGNRPRVIHKPIPTKPAEFSVLADLGNTRTTNLLIRRVTPMGWTPRDDLSDDSRKWSNAKWIQYARFFFNSWPNQFYNEEGARTGGYRFVFRPAEGFEDLYPATDEMVYLSGSADIPYDISIQGMALNLVSASMVRIVRRTPERMVVVEYALGGKVEYTGAQVKDDTVVMPGFPGDGKGIWVFGDRMFGPGDAVSLSDLSIPEDGRVRFEGKVFGTDSSLTVTLDEYDIDPDKRRYRLTTMVPNENGVIEKKTTTGLTHLVASGLMTTFMATDDQDAMYDMYLVGGGGSSCDVSSNDSRYILGKNQCPSRTDYWSDGAGSAGAVRVERLPPNSQIWGFSIGRGGIQKTGGGNAIGKYINHGSHDGENTYCSFKRPGDSPVQVYAEKGYGGGTEDGSTIHLSNTASTSKGDYYNFGPWGGGRVVRNKRPVSLGGNGWVQGGLGLADSDVSIPSCGSINADGSRKLKGGYFRELKYVIDKKVVPAGASVCAPIPLADGTTVNLDGAHVYRDPDGSLVSVKAGYGGGGTQNVWVKDVSKGERNLTPGGEGIIIINKRIYRA